MDMNYGSDLIFSAKRDSVPRETLQTIYRSIRWCGYSKYNDFLVVLVLISKSEGALRSLPPT